MKTDIARHRQIMLGRVAVVLEYLKEKGITCSVGTISLNTMGFFLRSSQDLDGVVEHFFKRWEAVCHVSIDVGPNESRALTIGFHPDDEICPS
jgi:hypothetical protein